jgi:hypothetical protein
MSPGVPKRNESYYQYKPISKHRTMSGIFLNVKEVKHDPASADSVLRLTPGGPPHFTLVYTVIDKDTSMPLGELMSKGTRVIDDCFGSHALLTHTVLSSFQKGDGTWRHDVLMVLDKATTVKMKQVQAEFDGYSCHPIPHVTHSCHATAEAAQAMMAMVNAQLPRRIYFTGVDFD